MKRFSIAIALLLAGAIPVLAQNGSDYTVDNFDLANSVQIRAAEPKPIPARSTSKVKLTSKGFAKTRLIETNINERMADLKTGNALAGFTTGNTNVDSFIVDSGTRNSVDPLLLYSIMHQESTFKPFALSNKGARGLMQLMPATARRFGVTSIFDPRQNIEGGARYVRFLLDKFSGDVALTLAGYNAGEGAVMKYGYRVPPYRETQEYVRRISKRYGLIRDPLAASHANTATPQQVASVRQKESSPLSIYERSVFVMRLPDGRVQLVSQ